jgi:spermidine/putrescine transport system ATP-binding protein
MITHPSVELLGVTRRYGETEAVSSLSLSIREGEFFSLIGPSGCGKTTTLRMIAGLEVPTAGRVRVRGRDVTSDPPHRRPVNTVFQQYALFPHLNVFDNVAFGLRERGVRRRDIGAPVRKMLELVELSARESARPRELSGGQQQRVALARALVLEPDVLLLDEPLGALDLQLRRQMQMLLKEVQRRVGITFVYVTHDQEEAFSMSDRVGVMHHGVLQQVGEPEEVYRRPASAFVADFVGASNRLAGTITGKSSDSSYLIDLDCTGRTVSVSGAQGLAAGSRVWIIVRPEACIIEGNPIGDEVGGEARVADVSFLGPQTVYKLESEQLGDLTVTASAHGVEHPPGSAIRVTWPIAKVWAVPMAERVSRSDNDPAASPPRPEPGSNANRSPAPREPAS